MHHLPFSGKRPFWPAKATFVQTLNHADRIALTFNLADQGRIALTLNLFNLDRISSGFFLRRCSLDNQPTKTKFDAEFYQYGDKRPGRADYWLTTITKIDTSWIWPGCLRKIITNISSQAKTLSQVHNKGKQAASQISVNHVASNNKYLAASP